LTSSYKQTWQSGGGQAVAGALRRVEAGDAGGREVAVSAKAERRGGEGREGGFNHKGHKGFHKGHQGRRGHRTQDSGHWTQRALDAEDARWLLGAEAVVISGGRW
jgi:hypothetical protein